MRILVRDRLSALQDLRKADPEVELEDALRSLLLDAARAFVGPELNGTDETGGRGANLRFFSGYQSLVNLEVSTHAPGDLHTRNKNKYDRHAKINKCMAAFLTHLCFSPGNSPVKVCSADTYSEEVSHACGTLATP